MLAILPRSLRLRYPRFGGQKPTYFGKDGRFCPGFAGQEGLRDYSTKFVNREGFVLHLGNKPNDQNPKAEIRRKPEGRSPRSESSTRQKDHGAKDRGRRSEVRA